MGLSWPWFPLAVDSSLAWQIFHVGKTFFLITHTTWGGKLQSSGIFRKLSRVHLRSVIKGHSSILLVYSSVSLFSWGKGKSHSSEQTTFRKLWKLLKLQSASDHMTWAFETSRPGKVSSWVLSVMLRMKIQSPWSWCNMAPAPGTVMGTFTHILGGNSDFSISGDKDNKAQLRSVSWVTSHTSKQQSWHSIPYSNHKTTLPITA